MAKTGFKRLINEVTTRQEAMTTVEASSVTFFRRNLYPLYQIKMERRWISQNASEGSTWQDISSQWRKTKIKLRNKDSAKYPGGEKVMVFTSNLFKSVVGRDRSFHRLTITPKKMTVATTIPYAEFVNEKRPFTGFGDVTNDEIKTRLSKFLLDALKKKRRGKK
ncbi:MAG: hypothetical protein BWZ03_00097 [bacterium ADurb.BinA186]|nr:MAG: hypothetical protein BWZ03_00097 [bacterium ADurb.BinA186]